MIKNSLNIDLADAVEMYVSGKTCSEIADFFGVSTSYIHVRLKASGTKMRNRRSPINASEVISLYTSGVSEKMVAEKFGVSRTPIRRILVANGIHVRRQSESETLKWSQMTNDKRKAQVSAANNAMRNAPPELHEASSIKQAITKQKSLSKVGHLEAEFEAAFKIRGFNPIPQYAFGPYNIDLAIGNTAIEIHGNSANPHAHTYYRKRVMKLLEGGWHVFYIKTTGKVSIHGAADQITRMINHAEWNNPSVCQYGVIRGTGELIASGCLDGDQLTIVDGTDGFFA